LYDGTPVDGPAGIRAFLVRHQEQYLRNVTQALMTYALGRGIEYDDMPMVRSVLHTAAHDNYRFKGLIEAVVMSDLFRMNVAPGTGDNGATLHTKVIGSGGSTTTSTTATPTVRALDPGN
jgi:hypothetical protein